MKKVRAIELLTSRSSTSVYLESSLSEGSALAVSRKFWTAQSAKPTSVGVICPLSKLGFEKGGGGVLLFTTTTDCEEFRF